MKRDTNLLIAILCDEPWPDDGPIMDRHLELLRQAGYLTPGGGFTLAGSDLAWLLRNVLPLIRDRQSEAFWADVPFSVLESLCRRYIERIVIPNIPTAG